MDDVNKYVNSPAVESPLCEVSNDTPVHALPNEILLNIFAKECDEEIGDSEYDYPEIFDSRRHPRRRKAFAALVRQVCRRWRNVVDDPYNTTFWIVRVGFRRKQVDLISLEDQSNELRTFIADSDGSDLAIRFLFDHGPFGNSVEELSPDELRALKLFINAMHTIIPFQRQLVSLEMISSHEHVCRYFLDILSRLVTTPRLAKVGLIYEASRKSFLQDFAIGEAVPDTPDLVFKGDPESARLPFPLICFGNIQSLTISHTAWMNALSLPSNLSHLNIHISWKPGQSIEDILEPLILHSALTSLRSLTINMMTKFMPRDILPTESFSETSIPYYDGGKHLDLPNLKTLRLESSISAASMWIEKVIDCLTCPNLRDVIAKFRTYPKAPDPEAPPWPTDLRSFDMPYLEKLTVTFPHSWARLHFFYRFRLTAPETLELSDSWRVQSKELEPLFYSRSQAILSEFSPRFLTLRLVESQNTLGLILAGIDRSRIHVLRVHILGRLQCDRQTPSLARLVYPALNEVELSGTSLIQLARILASLSADALQSLKLALRFNDDQEPESQDDGNEQRDAEGGKTYIKENPILLPAVRSGSIKLNQSLLVFIGLFSDFVPNIKELEVTIETESLPDWMPPDTGRGPYTARRKGQVEEPVIVTDAELFDRLCASFLPTENGVPFPSVQKLEATLVVEKEFNSFDTAHKEVLRLLRCREDAGAVPLHLDEFAVAPSKPYRSNGRSWGWNITFRATNKDSKT